MTMCYFCFSNAPTPTQFTWVNCKLCTDKFKNIGITSVWTGFRKGSELSVSELLLDWKDKQREFRFSWDIEKSFGSIATLGQYTVYEPFIKISVFPKGDIAQIINKLKLYLVFS